MRLANRPTTAPEVADVGEVAVEVVVAEGDLRRATGGVRCPHRLQDGAVGQHRRLDATALQDVPLDGPAVGQRAELLAAYAHPFSPERDTPSMMNRCEKRYSASTGALATTAPAISRS